ncbi:MAG: hypothetical protein LBQ24_06505 [Candidatus Peribacteria bacterium]|nr:hypothetical protein [Candidatus Peribacteria bacterium]
MLAYIFTVSSLEVLYISATFSSIATQRITCCKYFALHISNHFLSSSSRFSLEIFGFCFFISSLSVSIYSIFSVFLIFLRNSSLTLVTEFLFANQNISIILSSSLVAKFLAIPINFSGGSDNNAFIFLKSDISNISFCKAYLTISELPLVTNPTLNKSKILKRLSFKLLLLVSLKILSISSKLSVESKFLIHSNSFNLVIISVILVSIFSGLLRYFNISFNQFISSIIL